MTVNEWARDFRTFINELQMPRDDYNGIMEYIDDALALMKKQEAREPHYTTLKYLVDGTEVIVHHPECPRCIENGLMLWDAEIEKGQAYCKRCGQAVKWDD